VSAALVRRALAAGLPVVTTYGLTEAGSGVTALRDDEATDAPGSVGRPLPGISVRVIDPRGRDLPEGVRGRIAVSGPTLATGYDGDQRASRDTFVDGWLWTADLGWLDGRGRLWVADRLDDLIIRGGENVSPTEVEAVLAAHPAIEDAAVVARPDPAWGEVPVAAVVPRGGMTVPTLDELRAFARPRLAGYKLPADLHVVAEIPRTDSGKIVRRAVAAIVATGRPDRIEMSTSEVVRPDGATIHVEVRGRGPVIVLLHATLSNAGELRPLAQRLAVCARVVSIDRRSAGASRMPPDDPGGAIDVGVHVADVVGVLDQVTPGAPALAVGHSFGGCVALELGARIPTLIAGVWAFEPPYLTLLPATRPADVAALGDRLTALAREEGPTAAAFAFLDAVRGHGTSVRLPAEARARLGAEGRAAVADAGLQGLAPDELARIAAPVVIGLGGRSGGPYAAVATALKARIPGLAIERFADLGHGGPVSRPDALAASIVAFARRIGHLASRDPEQAQEAS
jgi:pimeloyl-ACP methyl ester carboxylesterase